MYSVSNLSNSSSLLQNVYTKPANSGSFKEYSEALAENIYAPTAGSRYSAQFGNIIPENFYDVLADQAPSIPSKDDFKDMYVRASANRLRTSTSDEALLISGQKSYMDLCYTYSSKKDRAIRSQNCICVPIGAGGFPQFMENIRQDLAEGLTLTDALQNRIDEYKEKNNTQGIANSNADLFYIDPESGEVAAVYQKARVTGTNDHDTHFTDEDAALELADDLATFLRYAAFGSDEDDQEKVEQLMSFLSRKQAYANYDRFIFDEDEDISVDNAGMARQIIAALTAAGVLKDEEEDEEEEAVDGLMEAIRVHQEELRENKIDIEESEKAIAEIREMLDSRVMR